MLIQVGIYNGIYDNLLYGGKLYSKVNQLDPYPKALTYLNLERFKYMLFRLLYFIGKVVTSAPTNRF